MDKLHKVLKKPVREMTSLEMWPVFLRFAPDPKYRELINEIMKQKEAIAVATEVLTTISQDEHERARLRSRRMFETDMVSNLLTAEERGRIAGHAEGMKEGMKEGLVEGMEVALTEVIRRMKADGMSIEDVARYTQLTVNEAMQYYEI